MVSLCDSGYSASKGLLPPTTLSKMPYDAFTDELGIDPSWEMSFTYDADLQYVIKHFEGKAVGLQKVGFTGLSNILIEERQWVTWAGDLFGTDGSFRSYASGPHGPLYLLLRDTSSVEKIPNKLGDSVVLTSNDWRAALMPEEFYFKLVYVLGVAQEMGLLRPGTRLREGLPGSECHILTYPASTDVQICSYAGYARVLIMEDLARLGKFEIISEVEATATSAMNSEGVGFLKPGETVTLEDVVVLRDKMNPRIRGCIQSSKGRCTKWISLMAPSTGHMWVRRIS